MAVIRGFLASRTTWTLVGAALLWTLLGVAARGLAKDPRFLARPALASVRGPAWGGDAVVFPVVERLRALGPMNLFDPDFGPRVRAAVAAFPGVSSVDAVRRLWPDRYAVDFTLHRPVAVVLREGRKIPVTHEGRVLPEAPYEHAVRGLFAIAGVESSAPVAGGVWGSELLRDGLETLFQLAPFAEEVAALDLRVIDVSGADDARRGVVLHGADDIAVRWGRPRATVGENSVARKIAFLRIAAAHVSRVRGLEIDVRYDDVFLRE